MMDIITTLLQIIVPLGIFNVWLLRAQKSTVYRGKASKSLKEEFVAYGLSKWMFYLIGFLKVSAAIAILLGFLYPSLTALGAAVISVLMLGALAMHFRVRDALLKSLPAALMLLMSLWLVFA
ncbi:MAG: hypothetical protein ACI9ZV_000204 [Candidatus Azotimanducaceae bacterium]|jgi:hypothetical protein